MNIYIAESGVDCEGGFILGVYYFQEDARKAILEHIKDCEYEKIRKVNDDFYEIGGYRYISVRKFTVR